ncbi:MAG TPA: hypothetical protein VKA84_24410 [Gemmatimonadaceae bacterium]|nr:hypothetical protein [Gemmatimonadaceae bacterium]
MADSAAPAIRTSLTAEALGAIAGRLRPANAALARRYPGDSGRRQPVHTVYAGAHLFTADSARAYGRAALQALEEYAPDWHDLVAATGMTEWSVAERVYERVVEKLRREPVEDFRLDYEDGYGVRGDAEEDSHAAAGAAEVARAMHEGTLPPFVGIRVKSLNDELYARSLRTLDIFVTTLLGEAGELPEGLLLTLPKVSTAEQAAAFAEALDRLEARLRLAAGTLRFEAMVETPQLVVDASGRSILPALVDAARGRLVGAHFGTYDYTASLSITAAYQRMRHPACDFARHVMQVSLAGTGVWLSDGSTAVIPVAPHRPQGSAALTARDEEENRAAVHRAWRMHYEDVRHSLESGFYQGWDLHPAQLVTRYAALYAFFLGGLGAQGERLRSFVARASQATVVGELFDDAATGQAMLNFFLRAMNSGALSEQEAVEMTGLTREELRGRSFAQVLRNRRA